MSDHTVDRDQSYTEGNYTQALENGITPDIHRLTHDGYDRLNNYGEVVSSKKGLTTNATKIQKKPTDIKFKAKPEVSINNNGVADLNQATKAYTQILLDEAKRMIDLNEFVVATVSSSWPRQPMTPSSTSRTIRMSRCLRRRPSDKAEDPLRGGAIVKSESPLKID